MVVENEQCYSCPVCKGVLNPEHAIIFLADNADCKILLGLHPMLGCYDLFVPKGTRIEPDSVWRFRCPLCLADLHVDENDDACSVMLSERGVEVKVFFSRTAGVHATVVVEQSDHAKGYGSALQWASIAQRKYLS